MKKNIQWLLPVLACIVASVASIFLPVLTYRYPNGQEASFNVFGFIEPIELSKILGTYSGSFVVNIDQTVVTILAICAVLAIIAAFVGVITMSLQRPNT